MPGWAGTTVALSAIVIAICISVLTTMLFLALKQARQQSESLAREVAQLRTDMAPTLDAIKRFGEQGLDVAKMAQDEAKEIIDTTRRVRYDVERGIKRAKQRLADLDAVVEVVQEEIEETALQVTTALQTARTGVGMIEQLRKLIRPRRRGAA